MTTHRWIARDDRAQHHAYPEAERDESATIPSACGHASIERASVDAGDDGPPAGGGCAFCRRVLGMANRRAVVS